MMDDIDRMLAEEAENAELHQHDDDRAPGYRRKYPPREPAQVYSVRIPADKLERLRERAAELGMAPSALMRQWVIERLESDETAISRAAFEQVIWVVATERLRGYLPAALTLSIFAHEQEADATARSKGGVVIPLPVTKDYRPQEHRTGTRA
jgi:hypothetical protein